MVGCTRIPQVTNMRARCSKLLEPVGRMAAWVAYSFAR